MISNDPCTKEELRLLLSKRLQRAIDVGNDTSAAYQTYYKAAAAVVRDIAAEKRKRFLAHNLAQGNKQVHYLSMEFLLGRSLKNHLLNLGLTELVEEIMREDYGVALDKLYDAEPDAGLGNGGLGRLAACYLDGLAHEKYPATGYCILYEFGMFHQVIIDGWQTELPDQWLPGGEVWLTPNPAHTVEVRFGGYMEESWVDGHLHVEHRGYTSVLAVPYDLNVTGYHSDGVSLLRTWRAKALVGLDMDSFNRGDYAGASEQNSVLEAISKVLYPNDNHNAGKLLRLRQQYFLCAASVSDICRRHMAVYGSLDNFAEKNALHINDTHPTLAIAELMRLLLDDCGYNWEASWEIVKKTFAYTNHTILPEALETWDETLFRTTLPRLHAIVGEIDRRYWEESRRAGMPEDAIFRTAPIGQGRVRMANLAVIGSHKVNGVSALHSGIIKEKTFHDFYLQTPDKFTNVTNGIASRRWLVGANPALDGLIREAIGGDYAADMNNLGKLNAFLDDSAFLARYGEAKQVNKRRFAAHIQKTTGQLLNPDSIFDVQVKRLHEYKRQQMNALDIIATAQYLMANPNAEIVPRTYIFGAKAAPGYFVAKQIIRMIYSIAAWIDREPRLSQSLKVIFLEEYNVTTSEILMPAADLSEQISLAGMEASGTGNMKLMLNGALTLGTYDGANIEIVQQAGEENAFIFGLRAHEVEALKKSGYNPRTYYDNSPVIRGAVDTLLQESKDESFPDIFRLFRDVDPYLVLADFDSYRTAREAAAKAYTDKPGWNRMALRNTAQSGIFCADRAVREYAENIWGLGEPIR